MPLSDDTQELANLKFVERAKDIIRQHEMDIAQLRSRWTHQHDAVDKAYLKMAEALGRSWADIHLQAFQDEDKLPDAGDLSRMGHEIENVVYGSVPELENPFTPSMIEAFHKLPMQIYTDLTNKVRRIELEKKAQQKMIERVTTAVRAQSKAHDETFSFVADPRIRAIVERDYAELQELNPEANPKSVLILSGGIIEGLLIDALVKSGEGEKETFEKFLKQLIYPAKTKGIIAQDSVGEWLRIFRNLVHPAKEIREGLPLTKDHARHARTSVDVIISEVRQWHSKNP
jgi:hypothetical protein